jgi:hypothetical protein
MHPEKNRMYNLNNDKQTDSIQNRFRNIGTIPIQKEQYGHFFNKDKNRTKARQT